MHVTRPDPFSSCGQVLSVLIFMLWPFASDGSRTGDMGRWPIDPAHGPWRMTFYELAATERQVGEKIAAELEVGDELTRTS